MTLGRVAGAMLVSLVLASASAAPALAQQPPAANTKEARQAQSLFKEGRQAFKAGEVEHALELFRKSQELFPSPGTLLNVAMCEADLGRTATALGLFRQALDQLPARDERAKLAQSRIDELDQKAPRLRLTAARDLPSDARVELDGEPLDPQGLGEERLLDPGEHQVVVHAAGRAPRTFTVQLDAGEREVLEAAATPLAAPRPAPARDAPPPSSGMSPKRMVGIGAIGLGAVGLGVGAVTGLMALSAKSDLADRCPDPDTCTKEGVALADRGRALSVVSTTAFVAGVATLGLGAYLTFTSSKQAGTAAASVGPSVLPGGGGLRAVGSF